jgi:hypothetical protein
MGKSHTAQMRMHSWNAHLNSCEVNSPLGAIGLIAEQNTLQTSELTGAL